MCVDGCLTRRANLQSLSGTSRLASKRACCAMESRYNMHSKAREWARARVPLDGVRDLRERWKSAKGSAKAKRARPTFEGSWPNAFALPSSLAMDLWPRIPPPQWLRVAAYFSS